MANLTYPQQQQLIKRYLAATVKNVETASALVVQASARRLKQLTAKELKSFKRGKSSRGSFHKAVKLYDYPKAKGVRGPAAFVRVGIPWISAFEEGETIAGKQGNMVIILLETGAALGFQRVNLKGWDAVWNQIKDRAVIIPDGNGNSFFVGIKNPQGGQPILIYKFQRSVTVPKKMHFYENAERLSEGMADEIAKLIK